VLLTAEQGESEPLPQAGCVVGTDTDIAGEVLGPVANRHTGRDEGDERIIDGALRARFFTERRPYRQAQNEVNTSTMWRTRSSSTSPSSSTTSRRMVSRDVV
jgi:hypothetical protein